MILDSIALNNFGVYGGRQEAVLAPNDDRRPIVLFGGMNGGGKTTLLDAVQLALYGPNHGRHAIRRIKKERKGHENEQ
ncbi:MAG: AAA family ATPase [Verrucomicrobiota bacterium]